MNAPLQMPRATIDDLMRYDGKAELIGGRIVPNLSPGLRSQCVGQRIYDSLNAWTLAAPGRGMPFADGMIFRVPELTSGRESFTADAAYSTGPFPAALDDVISGFPLFAAEVRSKGDYGPAADRECAAKRVDYFEAGTLVVWDVAPRDGVVRCYRSTDPLTPQVFGPGEEADAEPAVPGWRASVDDLLTRVDPRMMP